MGNLWKVWLVGVCVGTLCGCSESPSGSIGILSEGRVQGEDGLVSFGTGTPPVSMDVSLGATDGEALGDGINPMEDGLADSDTMEMDPDAEEGGMDLSDTSDGDEAPEPGDGAILLDIEEAVEDTEGPNQEDTEGQDDSGMGIDAESDVSEEPPASDQDGDGVPDENDLFPNDPDLPGTVKPNRVYGHSSTQLWNLETATNALEYECDFSWAPGAGFTGGQMTDIAIDRYGVLYGVTFGSLHTCHPETCACVHLGELPSSFNALTFVPAEVFGETSDVLIGIGGNGSWYRLEPGEVLWEAIFLGEYGGGYTSSGDAYSILGMGTFATVKKSGVSSDVLIRVDPLTGQWLEEVAVLDGLGGVYGLAGWSSRAYAFDSSGAIRIIETTTGAVVNTIVEAPVSWWGAATPTLGAE